MSRPPESWPGGGQKNMHLDFSSAVEEAKSQPSVATLLQEEDSSYTFNNCLTCFQYNIFGNISLIIERCIIYFLTH